MDQWSEKRKTCPCGGVRIEDVSFVVMFLCPQGARSVFVLHDGLLSTAVLRRVLGRAKTGPNDSRRGVSGAPQAHTVQRSSIELQWCMILQQYVYQQYECTYSRIILV